ncbi:MULTISPECIES: cupin domain-containing protein [Bradyrhizobium]|jgi:mannose-6-phosphate isomerase-like protein (cupin superfamily)|uniref:cupin domain-containing protein n=2 Tax=Nitrobacteraceae TaxID=41294 RepID=UPI00005DF2A0|nr:MULTISPECIES: cupin domain-containing protein [Bradyrhizobium]ABQ32895.1 hypothetical protein BBta_0625 [Bradyrhizobium sp. BTAi1]MCL8487766.1 cupin domain-containing protein [Bradyrhizobium denitrificans]RTL95520.1 MAG: cupin domain-containing protein [Bradyrhizobiaceae bacterium]
MSLRVGDYVRYADYRAHFDADVARPPVLWRRKDLLKVLDAADKDERGTVALSSTGTIDGLTIMDGLSMTVQVVPAGSSTRLHSHSWWHLFIIQSGHGVVWFGDGGDEAPVQAGDLLLVPAWSDHAFRCSSEDALVMAVLGNLPQQARLSNKLAREPGDPMAVGKRA